MMKLIQAACQWGQKDFDGWVIGKARYCIHRHPVNPSRKRLLPDMSCWKPLHMMQAVCPAGLLKYAWWTLMFSGIPEMSRGPGVCRDN